MYYYKCVIETWNCLGEGRVEAKDFIFANSDEEARAIICKKWGVRKNKKGLRVERIPIVTGKKTTKVLNQLIPETSYSVGLGHYDTSYYGRVKHQYCSICKRELKTENSYCEHCGAIFQ